MMESARPNFFLLLELNPDESWEYTLYQKALQYKIRQWNRDSMSVAKKALPAQANRALLPLIREVMEDPALRKKEADEAGKLLATRYQAARTHFEKQLMLLNLKEFVEPEEVDIFIKEFKHILPAQEIQKLITTKIHYARTSPAQVPQPLDASMTKNIQDRLEILRMQTLYEFLHSPRKSTTAALSQAAEVLYSAEVRKHPTAEVTTRIELAGFAMNLFKTNEMRARYDETLREMSLQQLLKDITESTKRSEIKEVHPKQVLYFIKIAEEAGWSEEEALAQLKEHGRIHQWCIIVPQPKVETSYHAPSVNQPVEAISQPDSEPVSQPYFRVLTSRNVRRRLKANIVILVQLIALIALMQQKPDLLRPILGFFTWGNQAYHSILALVVKGFQQGAQTLMTENKSFASFHPGISVVSFLLTVLINSLFIAFILTPGIPMLAILLGFVSGSVAGLKSLGKTLIGAHMPLYTRKKTTSFESIVFQPSQKSYPFEQGWLIENLAIENLTGTFHKLQLRWRNAADQLTDWKWKRKWFIAYWAYLLKSGCQLASLVQKGLSIEIGGLCTCFYTLFLLLWDAGALFCIGLLRVIQVFYPRLQYHAPSCPDCHSAISVPISICSTCITECPQRGPGLYGIIWYRCQGCRAKLPTLNLYASKSFTHLCPYCRHILKY